MKTLLILDVETDGTDEANDHLLEVGAVLWCGTEIASFAMLLRADSNAAEDVNGIQVSALQHPGTTDEMTVFSMLYQLEDHADVIVAHCNVDIHAKPFDERFLAAKGWHGKRPWLDSHGIEYPAKTKGKGLVELCIAHGVPVTRAHRALTDCQLLARLFERIVEMYGEAKLEGLIDRAMRPRKMYRARVSFDTNQLARDAHFKWNPERKSWLRRMAPEDVAALPFGVDEVAEK